MHNIKLLVSYDGRDYRGWQKNRLGPSIEETLQKVIEQIVQHPAPLQAASRTDAGVHAKGQVVNFFTPKSSFDLAQFRYSLNRLLPKDIVVLQATAMPLTFHPTLDCQGKEYHYFICHRPLQQPQHRFYSWHIPYLLNLDTIRQALPLLTGTHDFTAFCNVRKNVDYTNYVREIQFLELLELEEQRLCFRIRGNHFLYKMVRNVVGTLVDIGRGRMALETLPTILQSQSRPQAGVAAPAHGLFLHEIFYKSI